MFYIAAENALGKEQEEQKGTGKDTGPGRRWRDPADGPPPSPTRWIDPWDVPPQPRQVYDSHWVDPADFEPSASNPSTSPGNSHGRHLTDPAEFGPSTSSAPWPPTQPFSESSSAQSPPHSDLSSEHDAYHLTQKDFDSQQSPRSVASSMPSSTSPNLSQETIIYTPPATPATPLQLAVHDISDGNSDQASPAFEVSTTPPPPLESRRPITRSMTRKEGRTLFYLEPRFLF